MPFNLSKPEWVATTVGSQHGNPERSLHEQYSVDAIRRLQIVIWAFRRLEVAIFELKLQKNTAKRELQKTSEKLALKRGRTIEM